MTTSWLVQLRSGFNRTMLSIGKTHTQLIGAVIFLGAFSQCNFDPAQSSDTTLSQLLSSPKHGFVTKRAASKWEESMLIGNGTVGALVSGDPIRERIIISHEKLFMPQYPPYPAPDLSSRIESIRELILNGKSEEAAQVMMDAGKKVGINEMVWTDPLVPACQWEIEMLDNDSVDGYERGVNYESGEAMTAWESGGNYYDRRVFSSRTENAIVLKISSPSDSKINARMSLTQVPFAVEENNEEQSITFLESIEDTKTIIDKDGGLKYTTTFKKKWPGSLKGFVVETHLNTDGGEIVADHPWIYIRKARSITAITKVLLSYETPVVTNTGVQHIALNYEELLDRHQVVHGSMFNRFKFRLGLEPSHNFTPEKLLASSSFGTLNPNLVEQLCEAARYTLISSTGELPPTLQGIWGGTWLPAWSGDFTLNGNVPIAISSGLNTNFPEVTEAYMAYMFSMFDQFEENALGLYRSPGIFVPSRSSSSGKTYHYGAEYPHLFWLAGNAWTSQIFYDYWQYTGDEDHLKDKAIPFMLASAEFYENMLVVSENGNYMVIPSYSPEVAPIDGHPIAINATMDVAAIKQLMRNLLTLIDLGYLDTEKQTTWKNILHGLPPYEMDESGDLKEWIWPTYQNNNSHRHASHLYPLFYEMDPEFLDSPDLLKAAKTAIEKRMEYRRNMNGAEMAFGLVQLGLSAAHLGDADLALECVDYLCHSYWSPAFTSYHDPGEIFNVDICGGLPALVTEMIVQSSSVGVTLLPALPSEWPDGEIQGVGTRCGVTMDLRWESGKPVSASFEAHSDSDFQISFKNTTWDISMSNGESLNWEYGE